MKCTNNNQIFYECIFNIGCFTCFFGACHVKECIDDYFMKVIAHLYIFRRIFLLKKDKERNK
ncbi:hypothetical protein COE84_20900 [Bacillus wiedmannii]|nr:hypothetical protein COL58_10335 [Bacillus wiedmannii]PGD59852.1 hypothetical protein COM40_02670 [Bacillus wiedmannii]PHA19386.1 hypothetical protein COE59_30160 [Bacillus wiedmannii]PHB10612.1 hypothetical protein COE84_20900 [Bacillus wiedmannii]